MGFNIALHGHSKNFINLGKAHSIQVGF